MASVDSTPTYRPTYRWQPVSTILRERGEAPSLIVVPHEETDLHRVFCDHDFCLDDGRPTSGT